MNVERLFHYTFLEGKLIGSENPALFGNPRPMAEVLCKRYGIRHMMTLTEQYDAYDIPGVVRHHLPLSATFSSQDLSQTFPIIDSALVLKEPVWIHCQRGIDRTGCVIGGYLVARGHPAEKVIERLLEVLSKQIAHPQLRRLWKEEIELIRACGNSAASNKDHPVFRQPPHAEDLFSE